MDPFEQALRDVLDIIDGAANPAFAKREATRVILQLKTIAAITENCPVCKLRERAETRRPGDVRER